MKKVLVITLLFLFAMNILARGKEYDAKKEYPISDFSALFLRGGFKVFLIQGKQPGLTVEMDSDSGFDKIEVENRGDELSIVMKRDYVALKRCRVYLTFTHLNEILVEGGLKLDSKGYLDLNDLRIQLAGGANVDLQLKADEVKVIGEGGVLVNLDGVTNNLSLKLSGAGKVDAGELKAKDVDVRINGVGTGCVFATDNLYAEINGVGRIKYKGNPRVVKDIEGLGGVTQE